MKTALYIEDSIVQLVITPESDFEKNALNSFEGSGLEAKIFNGTFYDCRGGWTRQSEYYPNADRYGNSKDNSLILRMVTIKEGA
jgi:hypothetical protein